MRYLENAFKFTFKNILLALPLLIAMAVPAIVRGVGSIGLMLKLENINQIISDIISGNIASYGPNLLMNLYGPVFIISSLVAGIISLGLNIVFVPATYGLINKKYETDSAKLSDFTPCLSKFIGRYVQFLLLSIAIGLGVGIIFVVLIVISTVVMMVSEVAGILLMVLFVLALIVGIVTLKTYMALWFPSVCIDNTGVMQGLKNSFRQVKGSFWMILGITILINLCGFGGSMLLSLFVGWVPVIGSVAGSAVSVLVEFVTIVFYFDIYRSKVGKKDYIPEVPQLPEI